MKNIDKKTGLSSIIEELENLSLLANEKFGSLNAAQINYKYDERKWSIGELLEHLINTNKAYFTSYEKIIEGKRSENFLAKFPFIADFYGKMMIKTLGPNSEKFYRTPSIFDIKSKTAESGIVKEFISTQNDLINYIKECESLGAERIIISSPVSSAVVISVADSFRIITVHEQRHLKQAEKILGKTNFPPT